MQYELAKVLDGSRWLMEPAAFRAMVKRAEAATPEAIQAAMALYAQRQVGLKLVGDVAVIECCGPITYKSSWFSLYFGGASIEDMQAQLRAAETDPAVKTIAFRWDSPGGSVEMCQEFADELFAARGQKPIVSVADTMICSAAYWLASQTDTMYVSTSSRVGAIGAFCAHEDLSGLLERAGIKITLIAHGDKKTAGNPYEPLSDDARADLQAYVDEVGDLFDGSVARGRGVKKSVVLETFGQGQVFSGKQAIALGLADKTATFGQLLAKLTKGRVSAPATRATTVPPAPADVADPPVEAATKKTNASGCEICGKSSCACQASECPVDCPTCSPECPCVQPDEQDAGRAAALLSTLL